ncbi:hypothetical protein C8J57DRAFT_1247550 [Mycena rebaudengoi]|nr:hypothetical protein C8J57DRAFT_1247550 [Mycena rebaudengoi]
MRAPPATGEDSDKMMCIYQGAGACPRTGRSPAAAPSALRVLRRTRALRPAAPLRPPPNQNISKPPPNSTSRKPSNTVSGSPPPPSGGAQRMGAGVGIGMGGVLARWG